MRRLALFAFILSLLTIPTVSSSANVGVFQRSDCTTITALVANKTFCFDQTAGALKGWSGSAWVVIAATGDATTITATGSTTARALATRFAEIMNVKDFGAKGDGVTKEPEVLVFPVL